MASIPDSIRRTRTALGLRSAQRPELADRPMTARAGLRARTTADIDGDQDKYRLPNFVGQLQKHERWCWAAVAATISDYYHRIDGSPANRRPWTQCEVAGIRDDLGGTVDCSDPQVVEICNREYYLSDALTAVGIPHRFPKHSDFDSFNNIANEIGFHKRPVPIRLKLRGTVHGRAVHHFVIIWGYHWDATSFVVWDPGGKDRQPAPAAALDIHSELRSKEWTHTYYSDRRR